MARRKSIHIPGFSHVNPIPAGSRVGNVVMSGVILGRDPATGKVPPDLQEQCQLMLGHARAIVEAAGGTVDDIIKITVWLKNPEDREALNKEWVKMFPDPESRPARHALPQLEEGDALVRCDVTAVIGG